ncbi:MAG: hypothetical protein C6W56_14890 [Caldibacillus debilis]|nr:MAG: hypothetical protein C6W56_14890 [Caldibacillus debilis]
MPLPGSNAKEEPGGPVRSEEGAAMFSKVAAPFFAGGTGGVENRMASWMFVGSAGRFFAPLKMAEPSLINFS